MLAVTCQCGAVAVTVEERPPFVHDCNCSLCRKTGALWGYYHPSQVQIAGATTSYQRRDKPEPGVDIHFCPTCGATTHFTLSPAAIAVHGNVQLGVNLRLAAEADLAGVEQRYPDGAGWDGQGPFGYVREARILGR